MSFYKDFEMVCIGSGDSFVLAIIIFFLIIVEILYCKNIIEIVK